MQILVSIGKVGASPQIGKILPPCDVFDCPVLTFLSRSCDQVEQRWTDFHALWLKRRVSAQGWSFWEGGLERWMTIFGGNVAPTPPPPICVNRQFQDKTAKIEIAISPKL